MSAAPHVKAFCVDVARSKTIWTIQFADGSYIKWQNEDGTEIMPVWSSESRVMKAIACEADFDGASPVGIGFDEFVADWMPKLLDENTGLGPNWAGESLMGWEMGAQELMDRVQGTPGF